MKPTVLVISCEHAGCGVPHDYVHLFEHDKNVLTTHRAWDKGAGEIAAHLSKVFNCDSTKTTFTRLLIDCNRSLGHKDCFSEYSKSLAEDDRQRLIDHYYTPYREETEAVIRKHINNGNQVLHLSIHSFTPELNGISRNAAIGLLYDPARHGEQEVARLWHGLLLAQKPAYRVRKNYPYRGNADGFTSTLRKKYHEEDYLGLEVECNQALMEDAESFSQLQHVLAHTLDELLQLL